jgi:FlaA1/EpsC-like NDP-sugar epimerase
MFIKSANPVAFLLLDRSRPVKRVIVFCLDAFLCVLTVWLSFYLRLNEFVALSGPVLLPVFASICIAIPIFIFSGLYRAIFRYSGLPAMAAMARAMLLYGLLFAGLFTFYGFAGVPRTIGLIQPLLMLILVGASRAFARVWARVWRRAWAHVAPKRNACCA